MEAERLVRVAIALLSMMMLAQCRLAPRVTHGRLWFDRVTFALSAADTTRLGGPITKPEAETMRKAALGELARAYAEFGITFSDTGDACIRCV